MKIGVVGAGKWGSALSFALSQKNETLITSKTKRDLPNFVSLSEVLELDYLVVTVPAQSASAWLRDHFVYNGQKVLVASKGIEAVSGRFLNEIYAEFIPSDNIAFLSGPSFADEVEASLPTALVVNSTAKTTADEFASFFPSYIKSYVSDDVIGAEIAGAYKNVIAIAAGVCEGLALGKNAAAALIARGLVEMHRFGVAYGAKDETFLGLSGAGDLFLSASSQKSRNFRVGLALAGGKKLDEILEDLGEVAEGVGTARALQKIASKKSLYLPIAKEVYELLNGKDPLCSLRDLLSS
ncbi:MAG: NAD(P)H-dependent glycerol-3-phosphate dehydrogenase [Sulfuricurvum sp.]